MAKPLSPQARRLLDDANFGHLATLMPDGAPKVEPVWVGREGDQVIITSDARSMKVMNITRDDRVALSVIDFADPYEQLLIRGRVCEIREDPELEVLDRFSRNYLDRPFPRRSWTSRVVLVIEPSLVRHYRSTLSDPRTTRP